MFCSFRVFLNEKFIIQPDKSDMVCVCAQKQNTTGSSTKCVCGERIFLLREVQKMYIYKM